MGLPLWLKVAFTLWTLVWIPAYVGFLGFQNFLWLCDLCNFLVLIALWTESRLLFSSQMVSVLLLDVLWAVDAASALLTGVHPIGGTEYMFNPEIPVHIRLLSLFHLFVPVILVWAVARLGYDRRGVWLQSGIAWLVLPLTFLLTDPERNINWVWGPFGKTQSLLDERVYLLLCMVLYPALVYLPTHGLTLLASRLGRLR